MRRSVDSCGPERPEPIRPGRGCDWAGCACAGDYPAPRSRRNPGSYWWFCLDHVRTYNASWNYYEGMSEAEVEADRRSDTVWQRPSWRLGTGAGMQDFAGRHIRDDFGVFAGWSEAPPPLPPTPEQEALSVLNLTPPVTVASVKARYKELVKQHHPDANGGDKRSEERFKVISAAYRTVLDSLTV